jgi:hypothetical protein
MLTWAERRQQFRELSRLFFRRFIENDLISVDGDTRATLVGVLSLLIAPGGFFPLLEYVQFSSYPLGFTTWMVRDQAALPDKTLHIALSMTILGLMTVFEWDAMLPDRRDVAVLRPLPVGVGTMFAARIFALLRFWLILTAAVGAAPSVLFPIAVVQHAPAGVLPRYIVAHAITLVAANLFVFLTSIAFQGLLLAVLGGSRFRRLAPYAQFVLVVLILSLFFLSIGLVWGVNPDETPTMWIDSLPAFWFLGIEQLLLGFSQPMFDHLVSHSGPALLITALAASVAYAVSYRRSVSSSFEASDVAPAASGRIAPLLVAIANRLLVRKPAQRASFYFIWQTVLRSRTHRLLVAAFGGFGVALVFQGVTAAIAAGHPDWWRNTDGPLLVAPIILPLFLVTGFRYASTIPSDLGANWIFRLGCDTPEAYLDGARKAVLLLSIVPLVALLLPVFVVAWGWQLAILHVAYGVVLAWLLVEAQMAGLEKLPFTCSYVPGKANLKSWWTFYVIAYLAYVSFFSWLGLVLLAAPSRFAWLLLAAVAARLAIHLYRRRHLALNFHLSFDERPEPAVRTLGLSE